jgi:hypothetical protein
VSEHAIKPAVPDTDSEAAYIGISPHWLRLRRDNTERGHRVDASPYIEIGGAVRYRCFDLDAWVVPRAAYCSREVAHG